MIDDSGIEWSVVYEDRARAPCSDRALVLDSVGIPHQVISNGMDYHALAVPSALAEKAKFELWEYSQENQPAEQPVEKIKPDYERAIPGVFAYIFIVVVFGWMQSRSSFGLDWLGAGRVDGALIRDGEWWRSITALTLHGGLKHILGNLIFGLLFGLVAGGLVGSGLAWLTIVVAAALGNITNVLLLDEMHRSIGASTAVFASLGLISGFVWRARLMAQDRWAWRLGPIVGGLALLAYTGTGGENTDVGAHLTGFAWGFVGGLVLTRISSLHGARLLQLAAGAAAIGLVGVAWLIAQLTWI